MLATSILCITLINIGTTNVNPDAEDTREHKIQRFCQSRNAWEEAGSGHDSLKAYKFYLTAANWVNVPCQIVDDSPVDATFEADVNSFTDGQCGPYKLRSIRCNRLASLVEDPVEGTAAEFTVRSERSLLTQRIGPPATVGSFTAMIGDKFSEKTSHANSDKNCDRACSKLRNKETCEEDREGKAVQHDGTGLVPNDYTDCYRMARIDRYCMVLKFENNSDTLSLDGPVCSQQTGYPSPEYQFDYPEDGLLEQDALIEHLGVKYVTLRADDDPYVVAARITGGTFDFGRSEAALIIFGIFMIILGSCCGCICIGCFCACVCVTTPSD